MDPISIIGAVASVISCVSAAKTLLGWCCSIYDAPQYFRELHAHLIRFEVVIQSFENAVNVPLVQVFLLRAGTVCIIDSARTTLTELKNALANLPREGDNVDVSRLRAAFKLFTCQKYQKKLEEYCDYFKQLRDIVKEIQKFVESL